MGSSQSSPPAGASFHRSADSTPAPAAGAICSVSFLIQPHQQLTNPSIRHRQLFACFCLPQMSFLHLVQHLQSLLFFHPTSLSVPTGTFYFALTGTYHFAVTAGISVWVRDI